MILTRREFISKSICVASLLPVSIFPYQAFNKGLDNERLDINIFSKYLQFLDYKSTGEMAAELGFSGVDLTVSPKGHVLPEDVKTNLPKAIQEIKEGGSECKMITTNIESVNNTLDMDILQSASKCGIKYYRTNWFKYKEEQSMVDALKMYQEEINKLGVFNENLGLVGCYQNHAGKKVGASFWELKKIIETVNPEYFGIQYDIRHAMVEGGFSWENGLKLLHKNIKVMVLKDYKWSKINGKWQVVNVPIGEGMVDFKHYKLKPPVSLHLEYNLGGVERGKSIINVDKKVVFDAMKKDLNTIQQIWKQA